MRTIQMKNIFIALAFILSIVACKDTKSEIPTLTVTPSSGLSFAATNNTDATLQVTTNSDHWDYTVPEWVVAQKKENRLVVNVTDNDGDARTDSIIFTAGTAEAVVIPIVQSAQMITATLNNLLDADT